MLRAVKFRVDAFEKDPNDLAARKFDRKDINGDACALVKIRTDIEGLSFSSGVGVVGDVEFKTGEYWVYISPGEQQLEISRKGFVKLYYTIPLAVNSYDVFHMELTRQYTMIGKGDLTITSSPTNAKVKIDGLPDFSAQTPCDLNQYRSGPYHFTFTAQRYEPKDTIISIDPDQSKEIHLELSPLWGNLEVTTNNEARILLDGQPVGKAYVKLSGVENGVDIGKHELTIIQDHHESYKDSIEIKAGTLTKLEIYPEPIMAFCSFDANIDNARVLLDGKEIGSTPIEKYSLITGPHQVTMKKEGYGTFNEEVFVASDVENAVTGYLPLSRMITIHTKPEDATIIIDSKELGEAPQSTELLVGQHNIEIHHPDYKSLKETLVVDEQTDYHYALIRKEYHVKISTDPGGANLLIDDHIRKTSMFEGYMDKGRHKVKIRKSSHYPMIRHFDATSKEQSLHYKLRHRFNGKDVLTFDYLNYSGGLGGEGGRFQFFNLIMIGFATSEKLKVDNSFMLAGVNSDSCHLKRLEVGLTYPMKLFRFGFLHPRINYIQEYIEGSGEGNDDSKKSQRHYIAPGAEFSLDFTKGMLTGIVGANYVIPVNSKLNLEMNGIRTSTNDWNLAFEDRKGFQYYMGVRVSFALLMAIF
ncbi:MAG: PEGA domain-containing protein [Bacteroidales bacterium]|nr:PEGA domain-containing protein [Bacteroidales bacterium]